MEDKKQDPFDLESGVPGIEGQLRPRPKFSDRISKRVLFVAFALVALMVVVFLGSLSQIGENKIEPAKANSKNNLDKTDKGTGSVTPKDLIGGDTNEDGSSNGLPTDKPRTAGSLVFHDESVFVPPPSTTVKPEQSAAGTSVVPPISGGMIPKSNETGTGVDTNSAPLTPHQQAVMQAKQERLTRTAQARMNGMSAKSFDGDGAGGVNPTAGDAIRSALLDAAKNPAPQQGPMEPTQQQALPLSEQDEKLKFLKDLKKEDHGYHPNVPLPAISPNEVKAASYIPLILETGSNSDLPGQITARSSEAVYDTVTGCRELIPAMTKFVGRYDSKVALGQGRMLYAWNDAIFKDGSELNLAGMQGYDSSGQAGLEADVDNHYMRMFGYAFGMSMVTAGVQLSVPAAATSANGVVAAPTVAQTVATALSQQYGQLGAQLMGKSLSVQPTLRNFPGERFVIMVPHTIVFNKVWSNRCTGH